MKKVILILVMLICVTSSFAAIELKIKPGSTDVTVNVQMVDGTDGHTPETGLTITDIDMTYIRERSAAVKADATALGTVDAAHADNKAIEIDSTNAPGVYRFDWPDAAFASGVSFVTLVATCTGCEAEMITVDLSTVNANVVQWNGTNVVTPDTAGCPKVTIKDGTGTGEIDTSAGAVVTVTDVTNDVGITQTGADKVWSSTTRTVTAATNITSTGNVIGLHTDDKVLLAGTTHTGAVIPTVSTLTGHTPQTGDTYAALPTNFSDLAITVTTGKVTIGTNDDKTGYGLADDAITAAKFDETTAFPLASADSGSTQVARTGADGDTLKNLSDEIATVDTVVDAVKTKTDQLNFTGTDVKATLDGETVTVATNNDKTGYKLASDGLDSVSASEPSGDPSGWDFRDWLFWLCKIRFGGKTTCDNNWLKSYTAADSELTKQSVNDDGTTQTIEKVQVP